MADFFATVGKLITMIVDGISSFISLVGSGVSFIGAFFSFLPAPLAVMLVSALTIMIAIAIIKLL